MMGSARHRARGGPQGRLFAWILTAGAVPVLAGITAAFLLADHPRPPLVGTALAGLGALGLLVLLAYAAAVRLAAPIRRLQDAAALLIRSDRHTPLTSEAGDEIERLADGLHRVKETLERAVAGLGDEERLHAVAETAIDAIISADSRGNITFWNKGAEKTFGYASGEIIGKPLTLLMPERFRTAHEAGLRRLLTGGEPRVIGKIVELAGLKKDGTEFPIELSLSAWDTREGPHFAGIIRDITERKSAEDRLNYLKGYIETILDSMPNPILIVGQEERVEYINRASQDAFGLPDRDVSRVSLFDLIRADHATLEQMRGGLEQHVGVQQVTLASFPQGRPRQPEQARDPLSPPPGPGEGPPRNELQIGNSKYQYAWFHVNARPGDGKKAGLVLRDITEESLLHDQLIQAEKLAGLWVLTSGVAHELNNPLYAILGLSEALLDESEMDPMKEHAKGIVGEAKRMARIVQDFTGQARTEAAAPRVPVNINEQLDQALRSARMTLGGESLVVRTDYVEVPRIEANPLEIWQTLMNVITNAIQAMNGNGELHLKTETGGGAITVLIRDSGPGIPSAHVSKIFDPFFTTKRQGEGTGLGLTIARRIVTKYGGRIRVETHEGHGTTFILTFPCSEQS
jgi:PAS domain S-box-containing protein